jgi:hypothetical protein
MSRLTQEDFDGWCGTFGEAVLSLPQENTVYVGADDAGESLLVTGAVEPDESFYDDVNHLLISEQHVVAMMASRTLWSPEEHLPTIDAWLLIAVTPGLTARFAVRRLGVDTTWWEVQPDHAPWFALSTASGLRGVLETGEPLVFKAATDPRLTKAPGEGEAPPEDEHGRI